MQVLFVTNSFGCLGIANRLVTEGHKCQVYSPKGAGKFGKGIFDWTKNAYESIKECKFIIAEGEIEDRIYEWARNFNKPIIGSTPLTSLMNRDAYREYEIAAKLGVPLPTSEVIDDIGSMYDKILNWNSGRTLVRYDRETITCDYKQWFAWAMYKLPLGKKILLQSPAYGEEISIFGWFDGVKWLKPFLLKSNGETRLKASLALALKEKQWVTEVIEPWGNFLKMVDYKGPFSVRFIASRGKKEIIATHTGFEYPSTYAFFEGLKEEMGVFLNRVAFSSAGDPDMTSDYMSSMCVRTGLKDPAGIPILGLDEGNTKHIFLNCVDKIEDDILIADGDPLVYTVAAHGRDVSECIGRAYFTADRIKVPEPSYMTNLNSAYTPWLNKVKAIGYL